MRESAESIRAELKAVQDRLKHAIHHEKIESMRKDVRIIDWLDEIRKNFDEGNFEQSKKTSAYLYRALNNESISPTTLDYRSHFAKYISHGNEIRMPEEWGFSKKHMVELERGLTYSVGARPGTGKSTAMCNLAYHYAVEKVHLDYKVGIYTNEMKEGQLWVKLFQIHLNKTEGKSIPFILAKDWLRYPKKFPEMYRRVVEFAESIKKNLVIANVRKMDSTEIGVAVDETKNHFMRNIDIGFLDYLQRVPRSKGMASEERLSLIDTVQGISDKMMDIDAVMFIFSQMNKDGGFKGSEAPQEESGIAWELSRDSNRDGKLQPFINWKIVKSRITAYFPVMTRFDDRSGTMLNDAVDENDAEFGGDNPFDTKR